VFLKFKLGLFTYCPCRARWIGKRNGCRAAAWKSYPVITANYTTSRVSRSVPAGC